MKRKLSVFLTVIAILVCVAIPAFASPVEVNIWEYADIQVDGLTKEVIISFPQEWLQVGVYNNAWRLIATRDGNVSGFDLTEIDLPFEYLHVVFAPLGSVHNPSAQDSYDGRFPDFSDLPNGSVLHYSVSVQMQNASGESLNVANSYFNCSDLVQSGNTIQLRNPINEPVSVSSDPINGFYSSSYDFILADNSQPFVFQHHFFMSSSNSSSRWIFRLDDFTISTTIDALQDLVNATGETNRLLDEVNKKLDDITDYVPVPSDPSGGLGDAFDDAEQEVLDKVETGRDEIDTIIDEFSVYLEEFLPGIVVVSNWLNILLELKFIRVLLFFSLSFGMCGLFLGVANSFRGKS